MGGAGRPGCSIGACARRRRFPADGCAFVALRASEVSECKLQNEKYKSQNELEAVSCVCGSRAGSSPGSATARGEQQRGAGEHRQSACRLGDAVADVERGGVGETELSYVI